MAFRVAIVGRPNVGKSTLFNRLVGRRKALVDDVPGLTRDRREGAARLGDLRFTAIDTAGLEDAPAKALASRMREQTARALVAADVVLFVVDGRAGVTPLDRHFTGWLRKGGRPVILVANKCESRAAQTAIGEAAGLGFGDPVPVSAEHGEGLAELHAALLPFAPADAIMERGGTEAEDEPLAAPEDRPIRVAIVGRPNVGKSTLINRLLGDERVLTSPEAGTTRDAIEIPWEAQSRRFVLIDTAGLRRRARIDDRIERMSTADTIQTVREAQVVVLVLDATMSLEKQDLAIARLAVEEGRAMVLAINKWDLIEDPGAAMKELHRKLGFSLAQVPGIEIAPVSALLGRKLEALTRAIVRSFEIWNKRVPTPALNRWIQSVTESHPPPLVRGRRPRLRFARQVATRPPTIAVFGNNLTTLPDDYVRYLTNSLRDAFGLPGTVIRFELRQSDNPYAEK
jgi:GTPase